MERIKALAKDRGAIPAPVKRDAEHFRWAVRYQVGGEPVPVIAASPDNLRAVHAAIKDVLTLVGLGRRGRPKE